MRLRFYRDPDTGLPHLRRHGVTEDEAEEVLLSPGEDRPGKDGARVAVGQTENGRYLLYKDAGSTLLRRCSSAASREVAGFRHLDS